MKKRMIGAVLAAMLVLSMAGCTQKDSNNATEATTAGSETTAESYELVDYKEYATLGSYKDIEVTVDRSSLEVSDDEIQEQVDATLEAYASENQITEGVVQDGDTINLDFSGLLDGVAFSNGTATDVEYTVGGTAYSKYIDDLDRGLVGLEIGKEYEIPCTFPEDYGNEELNGKDVIFVVTVNYVIDYVYPEFNDDFVKQVAEDQGMDLATTQDMLEDIREYLYESKLQTFNQGKYTSIMNELMETTEFKSMPEEEYAYLQNTVRTNIENEFNTYGSYYGVEDVETFYTTYMAAMYGYDTLDAFVSGYAEQYLKEKMIVNLIAEAEGISVTEDELQEYGTQLATANGYESYDAVIEQFGDSIVEEFRYTLLQEKVYDFLVEQAVEKSA